MHVGRPKRSVVRETYGPLRSSYAEWRARLHQKVRQLRPLVDTQAAASHEAAGLSFKSERCLSAQILVKLRITDFGVVMGGVGLRRALLERSVEGCRCGRLRVAHAAGR